jgi:hypothetical protein
MLLVSSQTSARIAGGSTLRDLLFIAITAAFFSLSFAYAKAFDHL